MFRDLVSPRTSAAAELEAITAERDFFKEKYAAHASEMEAMKTQLKESQRMVDKLRNQVLDLSQQVMELEVEKSRSNAEDKKEQVDRASLAEISNSEHNMANAVDTQQLRRNSNVLSKVSTPQKQNAKEDESSEKENNVENEDVESEGDSDNDDDDSHDNDEAEAIRLKASRMLAWASYQSTRRTPTKTVDDEEVVMETPTQPITSRPSAAYTLPAKIQSLLDDDEDEDTDASSLVEQHQAVSDSKVTAKGGKIGKLVSNLKDMMGTQSESDSSYEVESDHESSSDSECSNLSENLARMQLDVRFADGQDEH
eukprot:CAMPEP_0201718618 /NCGR_PEP_ID=MMETSP0593-20130828/4094_1 /ASSEMBLY_ACC=CAM_ASM_000672 /TAXON_ID=267983 /ORGANISM="Skeletonema japonicum, Strain CCMP2506" /LENGTH=311 /DNA_ID=CAMNT_0048208961 /DNA_START=62 /DNA_END=997 /DNA_ORIENTATION=+